MTTPQVGDKLRFIPAAFTGEPNQDDRKAGAHPREVTGTVVFVSEKHRFYDVEYMVNGYRLRESFKYSEE